MKYISKNKIYEERKVNNYRELIEKCEKEYANKYAFTYKDSSKKIINISYIDYKKDVEGLGTSLLNMDLEDSRIGLISPDRYEWCVSYIAITNTNNVVVPLDFALPEIEIENLIKRSKIECIIFDKKYIEIIKRIIKSSNTKLKYAICLDYDKKTDEVFSYKELLEKGKELIEKGDNRYKQIKIDNNKMSILLFTSGTTSSSKAVMLSQYNICSNITAMTTLIKARKNDNILVFLPLHHTLACTASFLFCFYTGFKICFADSIKNVAKNMKEYEIRGLVCVPAVLELMYKKAIKEVKKQNKYFVFKIMSVISNALYKIGIDIRRKIFKSILEGFGGYLRIIIYGSASAKKEVIKFFTTIGIDMMQGYGLTETSPVIACESDAFHNKMKSTGYPLFNEKVKIVNQDKNGIGEIAVKGPNVMLGYYEDEKETKRVINDGWFYTGDLGYFDKKGQLYITGRKKDIIVLKNGKKVNPEELESIINQSEYIEESLIYKENNSDKINVKVVYSEGNELLEGKSKQEIHEIIKDEIKAINKTIPQYKHIYEVNITNQKLNKTTTNKIKRYEEIEKITK